MCESCGTPLQRGASWHSRDGMGGARSQERCRFQTTSVIRPEPERVSHAIGTWSSSYRRLAARLSAAYLGRASGASLVWLFSRAHFICVPSRLVPPFRPFLPGALRETPENTRCTQCPARLRSISSAKGASMPAPQGSSSGSSLKPRISIVTVQWLSSSRWHRGLAPPGLLHRQLRLHSHTRRRRRTHLASEAPMTTPGTRGIRLARVAEAARPSLFSSTNKVPADEPPVGTRGDGRRADHLSFPSQTISPNSLSRIQVPRPRTRSRRRPPWSWDHPAVPTISPVSSKRRTIVRPGTTSWDSPYQQARTASHAIHPSTPSAVPQKRWTRVGRQVDPRPQPIDGKAARRMTIAKSMATSRSARYDPWTRASLAASVQPSFRHDGGPLDGGHAAMPCFRPSRHGSWYL
jgi:hypothetical protein